jgi:hypothetical protein
VFVIGATNGHALVYMSVNGCVGAKTFVLARGGGEGSRREVCRDNSTDWRIIAIQKGTGVLVLVDFGPIERY